MDVQQRFRLLLAVCICYGVVAMIREYLPAFCRGFFIVHPFSAVANSYGFIKNLRRPCLVQFVMLSVRLKFVVPKVFY